MSKARELSKLLSGTLKVGALQAPAGTTAQRPSGQNGLIRYNSDLGKNEVYDSGGWAAVASPPLITTISPSTFNGESGTAFTINGSFFDIGATVKFITSGGTEYTAATITRNSNSQLVATTPQDFTVAQEPLSIKVVNPSGLSYTIENAVDCGGVPVWSNAAGTLATLWNDSTGTAATLQAVDTDAGSTVTYSIASGAIPAGLSLNSSTGVISGDPTDVASQTTSNFTAVATDNAGNQTSRAFSIIVRARPLIQVNGTNYSLNGTSQIFSTQGFYLVSPNIDMQVLLQLWGAGGAGGGGNSGPSRGSAGGYSEGYLNLVAGNTYAMLIGQGGRASVYGPSTSRDSGRSFPDGGNSNNNEGYGQGGGGGSSRFGAYQQSGFQLTNNSANYNNTLADYLMIAGAGAGGADYIYGYSGTPAGYGGGSSGANGGAWYPSGESLASCGGGGTQSSGGAGGTTPARLSWSESGAKYYGGGGSGSGGGGGYFGGGGARGYYSLGGGGSGYLSGSVISGSMSTASAGQSTHYISPNPRSNRPTNTGYGGVAGSSGSNGYDGAAIFTFNS